MISVSESNALLLAARKHKVRKEEQPRVPKSLFDRPTAALIKMRREAKLQKFKQGLIRPPLKTLPVLTKQPVLDSQAPDQPEWLIHEDWALLQVSIIYKSQMPDSQ